VHAPEFEVTKLPASAARTKSKGHGGVVVRRVWLPDEVGLEAIGRQRSVEPEELRFVSDLKDDRDGMRARWAGFSGRVRGHGEGDAEWQVPPEHDVMPGRGFERGVRALATAAGDGFA
jgi:hypothetical protein